MDEVASSRQTDAFNWISEFQVAGLFKLRQVGFGDSISAKNLLLNPVGLGRGPSRSAVQDRCKSWMTHHRICTGTHS